MGNHIKYEVNSTNKSESRKTLSTKDYAYFEENFQMNKDSIEQLFKTTFKPIAEKDDLDKAKFKELFRKIKPTNNILLDKITDLVFRSYDFDVNGRINFREFMFAYAALCLGDTKSRLKTLFSIYDYNFDKKITRHEMKIIISDLNPDLTPLEAQGVVNECFRKLDENHDGYITEDEFVECLSRREEFRKLLLELE